jgi:hypothetical protein
MKRTKMTMVLDGNHDDVVSLLSLAIENNLLQSVEYESGYPAARSSNGRERAPKAGDKVIVTADRALYGVNKGDKGQIVSLRRTGKGHSALIQWTDGTESSVAVSLLRRRTTR